MTTKIQFSQQERDLIATTDWILTKQSITEKIYELFGDFYDFQKRRIEASSFFSGDIFKRSGKIYKGENYLGLPYIMLDHPAIFNKNDLFVIRTMFWWGNFISITLHISGTHKLVLANNKLQTLEFLQKNDFFICVNKQEWHHHFGSENYRHATSFSSPLFEKIMEKDFFKVSKKIGIDEAENAYDFLVKSFEEIIGMINFNYPDGERDL